MLDNNAKVGTGGSSVEQQLRIDIPDNQAADAAYEGIGLLDEVENVEDEFNGRANRTQHLSEADPAKRPLNYTAANTSGSDMNRSSSHTMYNSLSDGSGPPAAIDMSKGGFASPASPKTLKNADADINIKPSKYELSPTGATRRTFFDRTFSKL